MFNVLSKLVQKHFWITKLDLKFPVNLTNKIVSHGSLCDELQLRLTCLLHDLGFNKFTGRTSAAYYDGYSNLTNCVLDCD